MFSRKGVAAVVIAVVVLTAGALLVTLRSRGRPAEEAPVAAKLAEKAKEAPKLSVKGAELEEKGPDGQVKWRVMAEGDLQWDKDRDRATGSNVKFVIVRKELTPVTVTAARFTADYQGRKLTFEEGVKGQLIGNAGSFTVNRLEYQFSTGKLVGTGGASFVKGPYKATARELVVDTAAEKVRLRGSVRFGATG